MSRLVLPSLAFLLTCALLPCPCPAEDTAAATFEKARQLESQGKLTDAFDAYLSVPGGEYAAVRIARPDPQKFLLRMAGASSLQRGLPRDTLVYNDLILAKGNREKALDGYRRLASRISAKSDVGWDQGFFPHDYYPVEPPVSHFRGTAVPFSLGPGSHRDNWFIRRFIALEAWDDAAREFQRIWELHRQRAVDSQFNTLGLQFAIDYAYFLKRREQADRAMEILLGPLAKMDMDRNPNRPGTGEWSPVFSAGCSAGISRKEFIRITHGFFKTRGQEDRLVQVLGKDILAGGNRARRIFARIRLHQGNVDEAIQLELAFVAEGGFDPFSSACRRARAYDDYGRLKEAAAEYEKVLSLPYAVPRLPEPDEEQIAALMMCSAPMLPGHLDPQTPAGKTQFVLDIVQRLQSIYGALGESDKALQATFRRYEVDPASLAAIDDVERTLQQFRTAGKEPDFIEWAEDGRKRIQDPAARASLLWVLGRHEEAATAIAEATRAEGERFHTLSAWKQRFRAAGQDKIRFLLQAVVAACPDDARSRLELLDLKGQLDHDEAVQSLEALLHADARILFSTGKGNQNRADIRSPFDLAYRLMRFYERSGQMDKLRTLGLAIARGEKPFGQARGYDPSQYQYRDENSLPEDLNACLALAIQHADAPALEALDHALAGSPHAPAKAQLERRRDGWKPKVAGAVGWANLPQGVTAFVCHENVLSLAADDERIYAGMPWGVAVYSHRGEPVTRVALGTAAVDLCVHRRAIWAATPAGLCRIQPGPWEVSILPLNQDIPERDRDPERVTSQAGALTIASDGPYLWIGTPRGIRRLDTDSNTLRIYSPEELGREDPIMCTQFILDTEYVWAGCRDGALRYDRRADCWTAVFLDDRPVGLVAIMDGTLWGHVSLNNELRDRPCLIDRKTLAVTPILIHETPDAGDRCINGPFAWFGTCRGQPVFGPDRPSFVYDPEIAKLRPIPRSPDGQPMDFASDLLPCLQSGHPWRKPDGVIVCHDDTTHKHEILPGVPFYARAWHMAKLPDGTTVVAGMRERSPRYQAVWEDRSEAYETWDEEGGIYWISPNRKQARRITSAARVDVLPGETVYDLVLGETRNHWVCTSRGIAALSEDGGVLGHFTRADGLCANRIVAGVETAERVYFAAGWGDHGGGIAVYDPKTAVFTTWLDSDGLATNKLAGLSLDAGKIRLTYDVEYLRYRSGNYRIHPPGQFDPTTGQVASGGDPRILNQSDAFATSSSRKEKPKPMPVLGGFILSERQHHGRTYLLGTRGMLILSEGAAPAVAHAPLEPRIVLDPAVEQRAAADALKVAVRSPDDLARYLKDENPFIRATALSKLLRDADIREYLPLVASQCSHPHLRVRSTALYILTRGKEWDGVIPALQTCLQDPNSYLRDVAAVELARRGSMPPMPILEEILAEKRRRGNFPFGPSSSVGDLVSREALYQALAPHMTRTILDLMLRYPIPVDSYEPRQKVLRTIGAWVAQHLDAIESLLKAYDRDPHSWGQVRFVQGVLEHAGKPALPRLHEALASPDRVIRSNAARACGAIGDPSSIPRLIAALDLESGLSRASIVWALGELEAKDALPRLAELYIDALNDEKRRSGAGYLAAQQAASVQTHYESISNIDAVGADWNELKAAMAPEPIDPRRQEDLLTPRHILDAVRSIGPEASQDFYRSLAGGKDAQGRMEAAIALAEGNPEDGERNVVVLRHLLSDAERGVAIRAAVSLLILRQNFAPRIILEWLRSPNEWERCHMLEQLSRAREPRILDFARPAIQTIAKDLTLRSETRDAASRLLQAEPRP